MKMEECLRSVSLADAEALIKAYEYGLMIMISDMKLVAVDGLELPDWDECIEAYFFNEDGQLHIYRNEEEQLIGVVMEEKKDLNYHDVTYALAENKKIFAGDKVIVREYLDVDEDGQTFVAYTRLKSITI